MPRTRRRIAWALLPAALSVCHGAAAAIEERVVEARAELLGMGEPHANNTVAGDALRAENPMLDVLSRLNRLPAVTVTQGDAIGGNDWSTRIYIRGMSNGTDNAEIGYMVDEMPNGSSVYGDGRKPSVFVDHENVRAVRVNQSTADIASASNAALGGTVAYFTDDPAAERRLRLGYAAGEHGLRRLFARADSGQLARDFTSYISVSDSSLDSWIGTGSGRFHRQHVDLKAVKHLAPGTSAKFRAAWNYRNETDYNSITLADFRANPVSDGLLDEFDIDNVALWRLGWGGTHWHRAATLAVRHEVDANTSVAVAPYVHRHQGWGWWVPPYRVATADGSVEGPQAAAEFYEGTFLRGPGGGLVAAPGTPTAPHACLRDRYPGDLLDYALAPNFDCASANRVASRRRSGYWTRRDGVTAQAQRTIGRHTLTAGAWFEQRRSSYNRQWFDLDPADPGTIKPAAAALHWTHFDRRFATVSQRYYVQDRIAFGALQISAALVHHAVETQYTSRIEAVQRTQSRSAWLPRLAALYAWPSAGGHVEAFASYSRNVHMLADDLLAAGTTGHLRPELSDNFDVGLRWNGSRAGVAVQAFAQRVADRLGAVNLAAVGGDHYLQGAIEILNIGSVASRGIELVGSIQLNDALTAYGTYARLDAEYKDAVPAEGIEAGRRLVNAAKHQWFGELTWQPSSGWRLALVAQHMGERPADLANATNVPAYTLLGVNAQYALPRATVQFNASNLTNERYLAAPDGDQGGTFFLGPARMASLAVRMAF